MSRFHPFAMLANQILQSIHCVGLGNIEFHGRFADVKIHFSRRAADVTEVRIGHFARAVYDATHDRNLHAFEVRGGRLDPRGRGLQIEQGPAARWTGHVISFENSRTGRLQNVVAQTQGLSRRFLALHQNSVADSVAEQRADIGRRREKSLEKMIAVLLLAEPWEL